MLWMWIVNILLILQICNLVKVHQEIDINLGMKW